MVCNGPGGMTRRSAWRATHSSLPTAGPVAGVCEPCGVESLIPQTFLMSARPRSPCGRKIMNAIRIENTIRSDHFVEM